MHAMNSEPSGTRMSTEEMKAFLRNHFEVKCPFGNALVVF
jgi:hypothetical protein